MASKMTKPCRNGPTCAHLNRGKCTFIHTEDDIAAAQKQRQVYNYKTQACETMCSDPGCPYAGPDDKDLMIENLKKIGQSHMIVQRSHEHDVRVAQYKEVGEMIANQAAIEAAQDAFAAADADEDEEIQAAAEEFFAEQEQKELMELLTAAFEVAPAAAVPQTPTKPNWVTVVKKVPGAPTKPAAVPGSICMSFPTIGDWGDEV
jgi:hypothetical protein